MATTRKQYSPKFKAKVAVEAIRGERTLSDQPFQRAQSAPRFQQDLRFWAIFSDLAITYGTTRVCRSKRVPPQVWLRNAIQGLSWPRPASRPGD